MAPTFFIAGFERVAGIASVVGDYTTGLIHYWPMTNAQVSGTTINDTIASGTNNGTASGAGITSATGPNTTYPQGRGFDGVSDISLTNPLFNWSGGAFTFAGWLNVTNINNFGNGGSSSQVLFNADNAGDGVNQFQLLSLHSIPGTVYAIVCGNQSYNTSGLLLVSGTWAHVTVTSTAAGGAIIVYVNGGTSAQTSASGSNSFGFAGAWFGSGADSSNSNNGAMTGAIAGYRLYNRVLAAADVAALYAAGG